MGIRATPSLSSGAVGREAHPSCRGMPEESSVEPPGAGPFLGEFTVTGAPAAMANAHT